mgnify:CR=1 FL=1
MTLRQKYRFPWLTVMITTISIVIFIILKSSIKQDIHNQYLYSNIGAPYAIQIYTGQYWGVLTNSFVHISYTPLFLNLIGLWIFAAFTERRLGFWRLFLLGFFATTITSMIQLTLSNDAGVGLSGVNFFFLGFILGKGLLNSLFEISYKRTLFGTAILIIFFSFYLNFTQNYTIGTEAMISGLFIGLIIGFTSEFKSQLIQIILTTTIWIGGLTTLFISPWSAEWNYSKGYIHQLNGNFSAAKKYYNNAIIIEPEHSVVKENLFIINVEELSDEALNAHQNEFYEKARHHYEELLAIDPSNTWAKDNMSRLP